MKREKTVIPVLEGVILEEEAELTIGELCRLCQCHAEYILDLVGEGILDPAGTDVQHYRFHGRCVMRAMKAMRLQNDMGMNLAGVAMVLDLLDEIERLKEMVTHELHR